MEKGKLIVADGNEGAGKTTVLKALHERLSHALGDEKVILTRQPGGTPLGNKIRTLLMDGDPNISMSAATEILLFCADRANHCDVLVRPALEMGKIVLCDRFDSSTIAYQIFGRSRREYFEAFRMVNGFAKGVGFGNEIIPDLTLFFDVDFETGLERVKRRNDGLTKFDAEEHSFHKRVYEGFKFQLADNPTWTRIDANRSKEDVDEQAWSAISLFLGI